MLALSICFFSFFSFTDCVSAFPVQARIRLIRSFVQREQIFHVPGEIISRKDFRGKSWNHKSPIFTSDLFALVRVGPSDLNIFKFVDPSPFAVRPNWYLFIVAVLSRGFLFLFPRELPRAIIRHRCECRWKRAFIARWVTVVSVAVGCGERRTVGRRLGIIFLLSSLSLSLCTRISRCCLYPCA